MTKKINLHHTSATQIATKLACLFLASMIFFAPAIAPAQENDSDKNSFQYRANKCLQDKTPAERQNFVKELGQAQQLLNQRRGFEALEKLFALEGICPEEPTLLNSIGSAYLSAIRDFDRAEAYYKKTIELYPNFFTAQFNLGELNFVRGDFDMALEHFNKLIGYWLNINQITKKLIDYKIYLCLLKLNREEDAMKIINKYNDMDDAPIYYLGKAALYFHRGEEELARNWLASAQRGTFKNSDFLLFVDSLFELGWVDSKK